MKLLRTKMKSYSLVACGMFVATLQQACSADDIQLAADEVVANNVADGAIKVSGDNQTYHVSIDGLKATRLRVVDGDFVASLGADSIYIEQNDDQKQRSFEIEATLADGSTRMLSMKQDVYTRGNSSAASFIHSHGVGYSYNARTGKLASIDDIKCQIVNRAMLDKYEDDALEELLIVNPNISKWTGENRVAHSFVEYIQNSNFSADASGNILVLGSGEYQSKAYIFEDGTEDKYYLSSKHSIPRAEYTLNSFAVKDLAKMHPEVLTSSFRAAVERIKKAKDWQIAVDSFVNIYGTHLITKATLGAKVNVDVQIETQKARTLEQQNATLDVDVLSGLYNYKSSSAMEQVAYNVLQESRCDVEVIGGNITILDDLLSLNLYQTDAVDASLFEKWQQSITFDMNNLDKSNVELIDMDVVPIYEFIADDDVAHKVMARITGDVQALIAILGNRNFINVKFPAKIADKMGIKYGGSSTATTISNPDVVNVIHSGRPVATICREYVPEISKTEKVTVVYPIYEGRVKLTNGVACYNNHAYSVCWDFESFSVNDMGVVSDASTVYITAGVPSFAAYGNIAYESCYTMPYVEMNQPFDVKGNFVSSCKKMLVEKHFGNFYLKDDRNSYDAIPNWTYTKNLPAGNQKYPDFINSSYANRMIRQEPTYIYLYNPKEAAYVN